MTRKLHIDIETYCGLDLRKVGSYRYLESLDFEIMLVAYCMDDKNIKIVDLAAGEKLKSPFFDALTNPNIIKCAHNANFERNAFKAFFGIDSPVEQWECSAVKASYCGLPMSLQYASKVAKLEEKGKLETGKALIRYFTMPCKPTKANKGRTRNLPTDAPEKWEEFKEYCIMDVEAERALSAKLEKYVFPEEEKQNYYLDQKINDTGVLVDPAFVENAQKFNSLFSAELTQTAKKLTGLTNPNSVAQLKQWIGQELGIEIKSLAKDKIPELLEEAQDAAAVREVLQIRQKASKSSVKKYTTMGLTTCFDERIRGLIAFYGAGRTGRFAGRGAQPQNLPRNYLEDLDFAREIVASGDYELMKLLYDNVSNVLSELIRTSFIPGEGRVFAVADFSAIEARVIAWLAGEQWRLDVFEGHGKIYEASASKMFGVPIESIGKGSELRMKGKVSELALGYGGSKGALVNMGALSMGLTEEELPSIVDKWRAANPAITNLWKTLEACAMRAIRTKKPVQGPKNMVFSYRFDKDLEHAVLSIKLPSGRKLYYQNAGFGLNKFERKCVVYYGLDSNKQWSKIDTYGGKLTENVVQAIARDLLTESLKRVDKEGYKIVLHVHDEIIVETPDFYPNVKLKQLCKIMSEPVPWAEGLPLAADGFLTNFYKKD